jgi:hypothetical protein
MELTRLLAAMINDDNASWIWCTKAKEQSGRKAGISVPPLAAQRFEQI